MTTIPLANTPTQASTPVIAPTATPILRTTSTPQAEPSSTPKPILIAVSNTAGDGADEEYKCLFGYDTYRFALYEDGQLVRFTGDGFLEKYLSAQEVKTLLTGIEKTGYFQIGGDGSLEEQDPIYNVPPSLGAPDSWGSTWIMVKGKAVTVKGSLWDYLIQPVSDTLAIVRDYSPEGMVSYTPQTLGLWIWDITGYQVDFAYATPIPPVVEWPSELASLDYLAKTRSYHRYWGNVENYAVLSGAAISGLVRLFNRFPGSRIFSQEGRTYYVVACPVLH